MIFIKDNINSYKDARRESVEYMLNLIDTTKHKFESGYSYHVTPNDFHCAFYVVSGRLNCDKKHVLKNDLFFIPKFSNSSFYVEESSEIIRIIFDYSNRIPVLKHGSIYVIRSTSEIRAQIKKIQELSLFRNTLPGVRESVLLNILNDVNRIALSGFDNVNLYRKAYKWIESQAQTAISAENAANAMNCSREHLNRVIKAVSGYNLSDLIAKERLLQVEQLCAIESLSVSDIAQKLDFGSSELLCKFFKYHKGISISKFRSTKV